MVEKHWIVDHEKETFSVLSLTESLYKNVFSFSKRGNLNLTEAANKYCKWVFGQVVMICSRKWLFIVPVITFNECLNSHWWDALSVMSVGRQK